MATPDSIPLKRCSKCEKEFPATREYFEVTSRRPGGLGYRCRKCANDYKRKWAQDNPERRKQHRDKWNAANPEYFQMRYYNKWIEVRAKRKEFYQENRERILVTMKEYVSKNLDKARARNHRRRARKRNAQGTYSASDIHLQLKSQKGKCWWCGKSVGDDYHIDHRIPLDKGGTNWPENICVSCPTCNLHKSNKMPWEWSDRLL